MATQQLFYERAVPVAPESHGNWSLAQRGDYGFTRAANSVPLAAVEFPLAAAEYAIVFAGGPGGLMPAAILGAQREQNLYLKDDGGWRARYVPAFVRRYPFVFASGDDGKTLTLCIDEAYGGFNQEARGERLFGDDAKPTEYLEKMLNFLKEFQTEFQRTLALCAHLKELDLLEPMQAKITLASGEAISLGGFQAVSREKLKGLDGPVLEKLARTGQLELIYLHLHSMRNFTTLSEWVAETMAPKAT